MSTYHLVGPLGVATRSIALRAWARQQLACKPP